MKYILIFGGSIAHGVGGELGGWADKIKQSLHGEMYGPSGAGEVCQVYELGIPGSTMRDILARFETEVNARVPHAAIDDTLIIFTAGVNDSKAKDSPQNYLFTPEEFAATTASFLRLAQSRARHVLGVGITPVDETKVYPKQNPLTGSTSYFKNSRLKTFEAALIHACKAAKVGFLPLFTKVPKIWDKDFLASDGIHPNDAGHRWMAAQIESKVREFIGKLQ